MAREQTGLKRLAAIEVQLNDALQLSFEAEENVLSYLIQLALTEVEDRINRLGPAGRDGRDGKDPVREAG